MSRDFKEIVNKRFDKSKGGVILSWDIQMLFDTADAPRNPLVIVEEKCKTIKDLAEEVFNALAKVSPKEDLERYSVTVEMSGSKKNKRYIVYFQRSKGDIADIDMVKVYTAFAMLCSIESISDEDKRFALERVKSFEYKGYTAQDL